MNYRIAKGVFDLLPTDELAWRESHLWHYLEEVIYELVSQYGFREIRTPLFEATELFRRSIGTSSDIVKKEMYTFEDRAGRSITLRPEGTAPVLRAFIEKHLEQQAPIQKFFYIYPMFRYERQQAGRYRQHHQFGVEAIGSSSPLQDVEVIHLLWTFYERLGLKDLTLQLNSIGSEESRLRYKKKLKAFLKPHLSALSQESQERYETNPFRILDSKAQQDRTILCEAPLILDSLSEKERENFEQICSLLEEASIPYVRAPYLVRGLDYYTNTVFEVTSEQLGAQNSLGGGGRYDGLIHELGGPDLPAIGFGTGLERILQTLLAQKAPLPSKPAPTLFFIPLGQPAERKCFALTCQLRKEGHDVELDMTGKRLKAAMRYADSIGAKFVAVIGEDELESGQLSLKEMATGASQTISIERLADAIRTNT